MREHEVPTHVQAEDRVLLWFTFPQIVALTAVCALSYGAYRYAPVGPSEVRMAIAVLMGLAGIAAVVGKIGGRRLPLVAADLLKYRLGARLYAGPPSQLARGLPASAGQAGEPPAPAQPVRSLPSRQAGGPGPLRMMARRAGKTLRRLRRRRGSRERKGGRMPFRPHLWFGRPKRTEADRDGINGKGKDKRRRKPFDFLAILAAVALAAAATLPQAVLADGHEPWREEIDFDLTEPVEGRRVFVEGLSVTGDRAAVTLRAATNIELRARAYGGPEGNWLRFWGSATLDEGERVSYSLPLHGPVPSFTFSWEDGLGQAGAFTVGHEWISHPLPEVEGDLCDLRVISLGWTPGALSGVVESECETVIEHPVELQTVAGHESVIETALVDAEVTEITGTLVAATGASQASYPFVEDGETSFRLPVGAGEAVHAVTIRADIEAALRIPIPPLTQLTHHPERTEYRTKTVSLWRPGTSETVSETVSVTNHDGTTTEHTISATLSIPGETVYRDVTLTIVHPEHVEAETVEREPLTRSREEHLSLASGVGADDPFAVLVLPEPEPEDPPAEQSPAGGDLSDWFRILGWEWPW